jgi:Sulfocyanin (SoxE) domain
MLAKSLALASAILAFSLPFEAAQAEQRLIPSWMKNDPGSKGVTIELVADWNEHTNVSDFNGFWAGSMTLIVPAGWSVRIELSNRAKSKQHSLMLTKPYALTEMPEMLSEQDAVWGVHTTPLDGIKPGETAQLSFVAQEPGSYFLACARRRHLAAGHHWIGFEVRNGLEQAVAVIDEDKFALGGLPGRP